MKKIIIFCLSILCAASVYSQSIKNSVCIVQPSDSDENIKFISELSSSLQNMNFEFSTIRASLNLRNDESVSAGFPVRLSDDSLAVVTTAGHFKYADRAKVTFLKDDGVVQELDNLPVIRKKENSGFVLIKLPENIGVTPVKFFTGELHEGDEVCSVSIEEDSVSVFRKGYINNPGDKTGTILHTIKPSYNSEKKCTYYGEPLFMIKNGTPFCVGMMADRSLGFSSSDLSKAETVKTIQSLIESEDAEGPDFLTPEDINEAVSDFSDGFKERSVLDVAARIKKYIGTGFAKEYAGGLIIKYYDKLSKEERKFVDAEFKFNVWAGIRGITAVYIARKMYDAKTELHYAIKKEGNFYSVTFSHSGKKPLVTLWKNSCGAHLVSFEPLLTETLPSASEKSRFDSVLGFVDFDDTDVFLNLRGGVLLPVEGEKKNKVNGGFASVSLDMNLFNFGLFFQNEETKISVEEELKDCTMNSGGFFIKFAIPFRIWRLGVFPWWEGRAGIANIEGIFTDGTFRMVSSSGVGLDLVLLLDSIVNPYFSAGAVTTEYNDRDPSNNFSIAAGIKLYFLDF